MVVQKVCRIVLLFIYFYNLTDFLFSSFWRMIFWVSELLVIRYCFGDIRRTTKIKSYCYKILWLPHIRKSSQNLSLIYSFILLEAASFKKFIIRRYVYCIVLCLYQLLEKNLLYSIVWIIALLLNLERLDIDYCNLSVCL